MLLVMLSVADTVFVTVAVEVWLEDNESVKLSVAVADNVSVAMLAVEPEMERVPLPVTLSVANDVSVTVIVDD